MERCPLRHLILGEAFDQADVAQVLGEPCRDLRPLIATGTAGVGDEEATRPALVLVAAGERQPVQRRKPSVYEIAHRQLNG